MASAKQIQIKESLKELKNLLKNASSQLITLRIRALIELKRTETTGISKRALGEAIGTSANSAQKWRSIYARQGIEPLLTHGRIGFKPSVFSNEEHRAIEKKLHQAENALKGYKELQSWIKEEFGKDVKYNTVLKYSMKNFNSSVKVARKSHVLKDAQAVENLKKTSAGIARKSAVKKGNTSKG
jgi:transposase